jgi:hypothetical protein
MFTGVMDQVLKKAARHMGSPIVFKAIAVMALFVLSACGGGGSGTPEVVAPPSLATAPVNYVSPGDGGPVKCCSAEFVLRNGDQSKYNGGVYQIILMDDKAGIKALAVSEPLVENSAGEVRWTPSISLDENRAYWWRWTAKYTTGGDISSPTGTFYSITKNSLKAMAPRNAGWMDVNFAATSTIAVYNAYVGGDTTVAYDIEVFPDPTLTVPVTSVAALPQDDGRYTVWHSAYIFQNGLTYYWRARAVVNGFPTAWAGTYTFTVQNPCNLSGHPYAAYAIDWTSPKQCSELEFTDPNEALGPPDTWVGMSPYRNFISLGDGGEMILEMDSTVIDRYGADITVYQFVSTEAMELLVGPTEVGPWYSLGAKWCGATCDFDLDYAGVAYARYIKIRDLASPEMRCHSTSGVDIDAVKWLQPIYDTGACGAFGGRTVSPATPKKGAAAITHTVPEWIKGDWNLAEISMGTNYSEYGMTFRVTDTGFEYQYPGCHVKGRLMMDPNVPISATNVYTMVMDEVTCSQEWDMTTMAGVTDYGYIWAWGNGQAFYRSSFTIGIDFWLYMR